MLLLARVFAALLLATFAAVPAVADPVDDLLRAEMKQRQIPGLALAVVRSGTTVRLQGYGLANLEWITPVTPVTVFEIGSLTKQFTAAAVLLLVQDGKLSLDDRLSRHLAGTPAAWSNITLRHLLTHTSGIRNYTGLPGFELTRHLTRDQFIAQLAAQPLDFSPGAGWAYSNSGYSLLGHVVAATAGCDYWSFLRQRILQPLQMDATRDRFPGVIVPGRAAGYEMTNHVLINRDYDLTDVFSAGALLSTASDLVKWDAALSSGHLLSPASLAEWWTPARLDDGTVKRYGFGWNLEPQAGHRCFGHGGATSGFSASIQRFPEDQLSVIVLTNSDELNVATILAKKVADLYLAGLPR